MYRCGEESFKKTVNRILHIGLATSTRESNRLQPFKVRPFDMGLRDGLSYDNIGELLEDLEGPDHR
jgi:hypothetical protein